MMEVDDVAMMGESRSVLHVVMVIISLMGFSW